MQILSGFTRSASGGLIKSKNDTRLHIGGSQFEAIAKGIKQPKKGRNLKQRKIENAQSINLMNAKSLEKMELNPIWANPQTQSYLKDNGYEMDFRAFEQKYHRQSKFKKEIDLLQ